MILANKNNLAVRFAAATEENRYTLKAILATENETVATDGHMLCRVSLPNQKAENFPTVEGFNPNGFTRGLIPVEVAKSIESAIPKSKNLPILRHAAITTEHTADDREVIKALTTDLENPKVFTVRPIEGQFPKWDSDSLWSSERPAVDVCFDARLLAAIAGAASKFSDNDRMCPVRLRLYSSNAAMRFDVVNDDGQEMNGLLMPCRASVNPTFKEPKPEPELVAAVEPEPEPVAAVEPEPEPVAAVEPEPEPVAAVEPEPEPVAAVEPESLQSIAGSGRLVIAAGFGYWDVSHYPYGGDFRRAEPNCKVTEIVRDLPDRGECEVVLYSGHRAIVRKVALVDYQY